MLYCCCGKSILDWLLFDTVVTILYWVYNEGIKQFQYIFKGKHTLIWISGYDYDGTKTASEHGLKVNDCDICKLNYAR